MTENDETRDGGVVVVGVDDSPGARAALVFAFRDAVRRGAAVRVVAAYAPPDYTRSGWPPAAAPTCPSTMDSPPRSGPAPSG